MKFRLAASALIATAGVVALGPSSASAYVVPPGDRTFPSPANAHTAARRNGASLRLPLAHKRSIAIDTPEGLIKFAQRQKSYVESKFASRNGKTNKREEVSLTDIGPDSFYIATVNVGTPAQSFDLVLDTGSSDLWIASSSCTQDVCTEVTTYDSSKSSTSISSTTSFDITYGTGGVSGQLYADTVSLAGYTVYNTTLGDVTTVKTDTIYEPASGIMGMGWQQLATSGATPFWQVLTKSNVLSTDAFTFQLARNSDATSSTSESTGGTFTLGEIDTSQYTGSVTYVDIPDTQVGELGYWSIYLDAVTVGSTKISTTDQYAVIDTGTTLIGGPSSAVESIYAAISGAETITQNGQATGYWAFPCSTTVSISFTFGGTAFSMDSSDFNAGSVGSNYCMGAIFEINLGSDGISWVIGDAFLKNVFAIFESSPARVGFATAATGTAEELIASDTARNGSEAAVSSIGLPTATTSASVATNTAITGGSGLPTPVAASTSAAASASSTSGNPTSSSLSSSSSRVIKAGLFGIIISSVCTVAAAGLLVI